MRFASVATLSILFGCASTNAALDKLRNLTNSNNQPVENKTLGENEKFLEYTLPIKKSPKQAYLNAKKWVAVTYASGTSVIQIDEPTESKFVLKGFMEQCYAFGAIRPYEVSYLLEFHAEGKEARLRFDKILDTTYGQQSGKTKGNMFSGLFHTTLPKTKSDLEQVEKNCFLKYKTGLAESL